MPALDGVRGIAVSLVLLYHFYIYQRTYAVRDPAWLLPAVKLFNLGSSMGWAGVEMFFVLSGFLITGILSDGKDGASLRGFYARRARRILPLYYTVLLLHLLVFRHLTLPTWANLEYVVRHQVWYWTFFTNFLFAAPDGWHRLTSHFWTLAIEEQFYLLWPLIVCRYRREHAMRACLAILVAGTLLRLGLALEGVRPQVSYLLTPTELDGLAAGAFLALAIRAPSARPFALRWGRELTIGAVAVICAMIVYRRAFSFSDPLVPVIGFSCLAIAFGALVLTAARASSEGMVGATLSHPALRFLGRYSYAIYLLHMPIIQLWRAPQRAESWLVSDGVPPFVAHVAYIAVVTSVVILAALVSWHTIESPFLRMRPAARLSALRRAGWIKVPARGSAADY